MATKIQGTAGPTLFGDKQTIYLNIVQQVGRRSLVRFSLSLSLSFSESDASFSPYFLLKTNYTHSMAPTSATAKAKRSASTQDPPVGRTQKAARRGQVGDVPTALVLDGAYPPML